jgi:hydrogenase maturation protease
MNMDAVTRVANAVLYEGYLLYPYRASAVKNQQRFNFGVLYPREHCESQQGSDMWQNQTEVLVTGNGSTHIEVKIRFLQMLVREGRQEGVEREFDVPERDLDSLVDSLHLPIRFQAGVDPDGTTRELVEGDLDLSARQIAEHLYRIKLVVRNCAAGGSSDRDETLLRSLVSVHSILRVRDGAFISLLDPPGEFRQAAAECQCIGTWPVLVGDQDQKDLLLSSPIILYDYPEIAPESPGDLFDGLEIDEILALRILTLTDEEKREVRSGDARARDILERTELLPPEHFQKLHGALRGLRPSAGNTP